MPPRATLAVCLWPVEDASADAGASIAATTIARLARPITPSIRHVRHSVYMGMRMGDTILRSTRGAMRVHDIAEPLVLRLEGARQVVEL